MYNRKRFKKIENLSLSLSLKNLCLKKKISSNSNSFKFFKILKIQKIKKEPTVHPKIAISKGRLSVFSKSLLSLSQLSVQFTKISLKRFLGRAAAKTKISVEKKERDVFSLSLCVLARRRSMFYSHVRSTLLSRSLFLSFSLISFRCGCA